jgi:hypothetical protein
MRFLIFVLWQSVFSRMAGGGIWPKRPFGFAEVMFALPFGITHFPEWYALIAVAWSYAWMQTGHGTAFLMGYGKNIAATGRKQTLSRVIDPICRLFRQPLGGSFYCWSFMGLKGLLIHMPLGLMALPAAVLWPCSYYIGHRIASKHGYDGGVIAELLAGASSGLCIGIFYLT